MMYIANRDSYMYNVYDLDSGLHFRQGHSGFDIIIKDRRRTEENFKNSGDYSEMNDEAKSKFLSWLFDTIFNGIEKIIFEEDL